MNLKKIVFPFHIDDPELNFKSIEFPLLFKKPFKNISEKCVSRDLCVLFCFLIDFKRCHTQLIVSLGKGCFLENVHCTYFIPNRNTYTNCTLSSKTENTKYYNRKTLNKKWTRLYPFQWHCKPIPVMRTGFFVKKTGFFSPVRKTSQGKPCFHHRAEFAVHRGAFCQFPFRWAKCHN